jgi:hypothetical protein
MPSVHTHTHTHTHTHGTCYLSGDGSDEVGVL